MADIGYDYLYAKEYSTKWLEIINHFNAMKGIRMVDRDKDNKIMSVHGQDIVHSYNGFNIKGRNDYNSFKYDNCLHKEPNLVFRYVHIRDNDFESWESIVSSSADDRNMKVDYFNNNNTIEQYRIINDKKRVLVSPYTKEEIEDEGYMFQQSLLYNKYDMFGMCCISWLHLLGATNMYAVSELEVQDMFRIHEEIFCANDSRY